jgi:hypothetical protein
VFSKQKFSINKENYKRNFSLIFIYNANVLSSVFFIESTALWPTLFVEDEGGRTADDDSAAGATLFFFDGDHRVSELGVVALSTARLCFFFYNRKTLNNSCDINKQRALRK